jgi:DNA-binding response OmpR family regulator
MDGAFPFLIYVVEDDHDDFSFLKSVVMAHWTNIRLVHFDQPDKFVADLNLLDVPALVILDINMPRLNGLQVMYKMKENPRWIKMPFLFLSTASNDDHKKEAMAGGASSYLIKPPTFEQWKTIVVELERIRMKEHEILYGIG